MHVPQEVRERVADKILECLVKAEDHYCRTFSIPTVFYNLRGQVAGRAFCGQWLIKLNAVLLMENLDDFIARTVPHELAHLIDYKLHPENFTRTIGGKRDIHGRTWKMIMVLFEADYSRCHSFDTTNSKVQKTPQTKYKWVCQECGVEMLLGSKRHSNMKSGTRTYMSKRCGNWAHTYKFVGVVRPSVTPLPQAADAPSIPTQRTSESKREGAERIYLANRDKMTRGMIINLFITQLGMTKAGASTYYQNAKKKLG